jgi:hypothetical protein
MSLISPSLRLLRLLPAICSTVTLQFAIDEQLIFGTWVHPALRERANANLPPWWTLGGLRWRWVIIVGYLANYIFGVLNLLVARDQLEATGSTNWYTAGLFFSIAHMLFVRMALGKISAIEKDIPKGNVTNSMAAWLRMNWIRGWITDFPAWLCCIVAVVKAL